MKEKNRGKARHPEHLDSHFDEEELENEFRSLDKINRLTRTPQMVTKMIENVLKEKGMERFSVLEVGCGTGDTAVFIAEWARKKGHKAEITAWDSCPSAIRMAREKAADYPEVNIQEADILKKPLQKNSYDFVLIIFTMHHFKDKEDLEVMKKLHNAAKHMLLVDDFIRDRLALGFIKLTNYLLIPFIDKRSREDAITSIKNSYTIDEIKDLCKKSGIKELNIGRRIFYRFVLVARK